MNHIRPFGDQGFLVDVADAAEAQALARRLVGRAPFIDVAPGLDSVLAVFDPAITPPERARNVLLEVQQEDKTRTVNGVHRTLCVNYGGDFGPDLGAIAAASGLSPEALIAAHESVRYTVAMIGFTPGFAYLEGPPPPWRAERLAEPRARVPAGSVGLVGPWCGVYALDGPGGWPIIGRVTEPLFDRAADPPFRLSPCDTVCFRAAL